MNALPKAAPGWVITDVEDIRLGGRDAIDQETALYSEHEVNYLK